MHQSHIHKTAAVDAIEDRRQFLICTWYPITDERNHFTFGDEEFGYQLPFLSYTVLFLAITGYVLLKVFKGSASVTPQSSSSATGSKSNT